ncbi:MAG TPA: alpha/beta hydrolase [Spirochaetota bacterium]|nr:alpha/beta hydrolase [Spirochaetota bacterium]
MPSPSGEILHFAHANGFPGESYRVLLDCFSRDYRIIAVDRLGHSVDYPVNNNWSNLADELIAHVEKKADRPVIGAGHSLGSIVTFMAAHKRPDLFRAVIMLDPPFFWGSAGLVFRLMKFTGIADRFTPARQSSGRKRYWADMETARAYFQSKSLFRAFDPQSLEDYIRCGTVEGPGGVSLAYDVETEVRIFQTMPDNISRYNKIRGVPGCIIYGENSRAVHMKSLNKFTERHGFTLRTSPGGHLFPLEKPREAAEIIKRELDQLLK